MALTDKKPCEETVQDLNLGAIAKTRFRIDGDSSRILELNLSDMGIIPRLEAELKTLHKLVTTRFSTDELDPSVIEEVDKEMRASVDRIFQTNASEVCAPDGTMVDPINGQLRYEHIIDALTKLYEENINNEYKKMNERIKKHTAKYTKKR